MYVYMNTFKISKFLLYVCVYTCMYVYCSSAHKCKNLLENAQISCPCVTTLE